MKTTFITLALFATLALCAAPKMNTLGDFFNGYTF